MAPSASGNGKGKGKVLSREESNEERVSSFIANVPQDILCALMSELENRVRRRTHEGNDSDLSFRPSMQEKEKNLEKKRSLKRRQSTNSSNNSVAETSAQGSRRNSRKQCVVTNRHVVLSCSSSSDESDELESDQEDPRVDKDILEEIDLSYNVQFRKLSKSQVCFHKGDLLKDEAGREFEQKASDALKSYCREVDKLFKEIKPRHLQRTLKYIYEQFGDGLCEADILRFLKKRWRHWREHLRRKVRNNNAPRPMHVDEESWKKFVELCGRDYQRQKNAASKRKNQQRTGSGGIMSIKTKFFQDWGSMPTEDLLREIMSNGGYEAFKKKMIAKGCVPQKHKALDYLKGASPGIIFKVKSKKSKQTMDTNTCYINTDSDEEKEEEEKEDDDGINRNEDGISGSENEGNRNNLENEEN